MKTASTEREAIGHVTGDALRPVLARLRRSSRYAVFGLAAITIAGCGAPISWECQMKDGATETFARHGSAPPTVFGGVDSTGWSWDGDQIEACREIRGEQ